MNPFIFWHILNAQSKGQYSVQRNNWDEKSV